MAKQEPPKPDPVRLHMLLTQEEAQELDDWRYAHRHPTRTAAVKALMRLGYEALPAPSAPPKPRAKKGRAA